MILWAAGRVLSHQGAGQMGLLRNPISQAVVSITPHCLLLSLAVEAFLIDQFRKGNWLLWGKVARLRAEVRLWRPKLVNNNKKETI